MSTLDKKLREIADWLFEECSALGLAAPRLKINRAVARAAALGARDALDRARDYLMHEEDCDSEWGDEDPPCSCGLSDLVIDVLNHTETAPRSEES